jgi:predicted nucleic acid-binding protein
LRGLLDTSVFVGREAGRAVDELPDEAALSVITLAELTLGVRMAEQRGDSDLAGLRQATLDAVAVTFDVLAVDRQIASVCAAIRAGGRARNLRFGPFDSLIAATAVVHGLPLYTQDTQFSDMVGVQTRLI